MLANELGRGEPNDIWFISLILALKNKREMGVMD
jgi:hypothetical protein